MTNKADNADFHKKKAKGLLLVFMLRQKRNLRMAKSFYQIRATLFAKSAEKDPADESNRSENKAALYDQIQ